MICLKHGFPYVGLAFTKEHVGALPMLLNERFKADMLHQRLESQVFKSMQEKTNH